jgi:hypothetical protein
MKSGMLWFDNNTKTNLAQKLETAATYYEIKFGRKPTAAHVNPKDLTQAQKINDINVSPLRSILPHHILIGVDEA